MKTREASDPGAEETNTRGRPGTNNVSSIERKRRETLYLPTSFDPSPSPSLLSVTLSHILPLPGSSEECASVLDPCSGGYTPPSVCRCYHRRSCRMTAHTHTHTLALTLVCLLSAAEQRMPLHWTLSVIYVMSVKATEQPRPVWGSQRCDGVCTQLLTRRAALTAIFKKKKEKRKKKQGKNSQHPLKTKKPRSLFAATVWKIVMMSLHQSE